MHVVSRSASHGGRAWRGAMVGGISLGGIYIVHKGWMLPYSTQQSKSHSSDPREHHVRERFSLERDAVCYAIVGGVPRIDWLTFMCGACGYVYCPPDLRVVAMERACPGRAVACCAGERTKVGSEAMGTGNTCNGAIVPS